MHDCERECASTDQLVRNGCTVAEGADNLRGGEVPGGKLLQELLGSEVLGDGQLSLGEQSSREGSSVGQLFRRGHSIDSPMIWQQRINGLALLAADALPRKLSGLGRHEGSKPKRHKSKGQLSASSTLTVPQSRLGGKQR